MASNIYAYVTKSPTSGNGLFAKKEVGGGELIVKLARPMIAALDYSRLEDTCANCYASKTASSIRNREYGKAGEQFFKLSACTGCKVVKYCGKVRDKRRVRFSIHGLTDRTKKCQSRAWKRHHKVNCKLFNRIPTRLLSNAVRAILQIRAMEALGTLEEHWHAFAGLESHAEQFSGQHRKYWNETEQVLSLLDQFTQEEMQIRGMAKQDLHGRVLTNSLTLVTAVFDPIGICLDPLVAASNHSCEPNAAIVMDGPELSMRSLRRIAKDEEIFIAYVDTTNPFSYRQQELSSRYFFDCSCRKCRTGSELEMEKDRNKAAVQAAGLEKLKQAKKAGAAEAVTKLEDGLKMCFECGAIGLTEQPYAALRHSLMVNLISSGKYDVGFMQGIKMYCHVEPGIFDESFHPVRVARNWVLLRLICALLADYRYREYMSELMARSGVDFAIVVYHMFQDVVDAVDKSHGRESSLAKSIGEEFEATLDTLDARDAGMKAAYSAARAAQFSKLEQLANTVEM
ncbi:SET domain-containing protein [Pseudovirgaria hyperparasitica]|uniref:SET domain-containing protein n=1 Tax=Pseudovirgaria hyperparasitica TaxID=470096 RepID=A0A6A6VXA4_9PEZI|nr:SET domain-containing protein [Pseudovirgaria hyperparasitica]KAF2754334.1 SET domain-containing protein [Pseudovirgaria hyperparasitica]